MGWPKGVPHAPEMIARRIASLVSGGKRRKQPIVVDGERLWECGTCRVAKSTDDFYACKKSTNGIKSQCKTCHTQCTIRTRNPEIAADANREYMRRRSARDSDRARARWRADAAKRTPTLQSKARAMFNRAVRRGKIIRPAKCSACGTDKRRICGHHNDYSKPLDVTWLCDQCHGIEHRKAGRK